MIDIAKYSALKAAGAIISITHTGDVVTITTKTFDPNTGAQLDDDITTLSLIALNEHSDYYQGSYNNIASLIGDAVAI